VPEKLQVQLENLRRQRLDQQVRGKLLYIRIKSQNFSLKNRLFTFISFRPLPTSTQTTKQDQEPLISDWAPLVSVGGLAAMLGDAKLRKLDCRQRLQKIADKLGGNEPECSCAVNHFFMINYQMFRSAHFD
jgi:hypothetical protein